jgi:uncharacterized protein YbcI
MGRGPLETKTYIFDDMILVRLKGILTKGEYSLAKSDHPSRGRALIKQVRIEMIENSRHILETKIKEITRRKVKTLHIDISTVNGEKVIVFVLDRVLEIV